MTGSDELGRRLHVVLVHRYFFPDTPPYASMLREIAGSLVARGHRVTVLTCQPSYRRNVVARAPRRESLEGISVVRWPVLDDRRSTVLKVVNTVWYAARLLGSRGRVRDADVVMAATTPPVAIALVASWLARLVGARFVYHKQDIWPEVSWAGEGRPGALDRLMKRVDHGTERRAARVVVLSSDMADTVGHRSEDPVETLVINNFDPWSIGEDDDEPVRASGPGLTLGFAGNLGRFQGIERLLELVKATADEPALAWHFYGDGPMSVPLARLAEEGAQVVMHGYRPAHEVATFLHRECDLGVVSLNPGVIRAAYPSKTMSYLRNGCPVLALVEPDSELARMVASERIGLAGDIDQILDLADSLRHWARDPAPLHSMRTRAREVYEERFSRTRQVARWVDLFEDVAS